jgi:hypothetical protein
MKQRLLTLVLLAAFVASSTGLVLTLHLHEQAVDHDSHACGLCQSLICSSLAVANPPHVSLAPPVVVGSVAAPVAAVPFVRIAHLTFGSRAPPLV